MKQLGDIQAIKNAPFVDCITFGSPCQDLSIAGKRAGLAGERSGLFMEAVRIIKEMEEQSGGLYPTFAIWENVPGAFSSNKGRDFQAVLEELAKIKEPEVSIPQSDKWAKAGFICGNGWSIAWRTLDAQFWGVPQRRRRIALIMDLRGQRAGKILFERKGLPGNFEPSIPPWKGIARDPAHGTAGHDRVVETAIPINTQIATRHISLGERTGMGWGEDGDPAYTLQAGHEHAVCCAAYPGKARSLTARYDGSPCADRGPNVVCLQGNMIDRDVQQNGSGVSESETMFTLNATDRHGVCYAIGNGQVNQIGLSDVARSLDCMNDPQAIVFESHSQDARYTQQGDTSPACTAQWGTGGNNMPLVAEKHGFQNTGVGWWNKSDVGATLRTPCGGDALLANVIAESVDCRNHKSNGDLSGTIQAKENGGFSLNYINPVAIKILRWIVRRLIPTECERLQGYPDGWTDIGEWVDSKGKRHKPADSPRYKALGNSIALPQWWWITCKMARYLPERATLGSLFDGIGGFPLVWETFHGKGTALWASEIEEFPIAVTKIRFPEGEQ